MVAQRRRQGNKTKLELMDADPMVNHDRLMISLTTANRPLSLDRVTAPQQAQIAGRAPVHEKQRDPGECRQDRQQNFQRDRSGQESDQ